MASGHTANYQLNLWEPTDTFARTEFNEDNRKIDNMFGPSNLPWYLGDYVGTTTAAGETQMVMVGFRPSLLIVVGPGAFGVAVRHSSNIAQASNVVFQDGTNIISTELSLTTTGFRITRFSTTGPTLAEMNERYVYFALR